MAIPLEQKRALRLLERRKTAPQIMSEAEELEGAGAGWKAIIIVSGLMMLLFAAANDVLDIFVIGQIPILGDILDFIMWAAIWLWVFFSGLSRPPAFVFEMFAGIIVEIIPVIETIPAFTLLVLSIILYNLFAKKVIEKAMKTVSI